MSSVLVNLVVSAGAVVISAYFVPGVIVSSVSTALLVALVMAVVNAIIKPIVHLFALPLTIFTLGLFAFVINALMVLLVDYLVPGFTVGGFFPALLFSIVLSLVTSIIHTLFRS